MPISLSQANQPEGKEAFRPAPTRRSGATISTREQALAEQKIAANLNASRQPCRARKVIPPNPSETGFSPVHSPDSKAGKQGLQALSYRNSKIFFDAP
ncbi:MAG: hypothetical protein AB7G28_02215 [Pirellulales bacterium]